MKRSLFWLAAAAAGWTCQPAVFAATVSANLEPNDAAHLETVIVSAPLRKTQAETALPVTVLDGAELRDRAAGSIGATLDNSPGLANASFGPGVGQPVIRGQSGPRVQVLENGTSSADAAGVSADHAVAVEALLADSIEVLRGPAALLYGGGAIGGVVNVIDNRIPRSLPEKTGGSIELRHNSADDDSAGVLKLEGAAGNLAWHLDGVYRDWNDVDIPGHAFDRRHLDTEYSSDGHIANTGGRNRSASGGLSWIFDQGYLGFSVTDLRNKYGIPLNEEAEGDAINGVHIDMQQQRYDIAGEWRPEGGPLSAIRERLTYTDYEHSEVENTGEIGTTFTNETWENRLELVHREIAGWTGVVGLQLKRSDFAAQGEEGFIPESISRSSGVFVVEDYRAGAWIYELGLRYDRDSVDPDGAGLRRRNFDNLSGSASALWNIDSQWSLGLALSRSQRAPTVEELFSNSGAEAGDLVVHEATEAIEVGSADLKQETSRNIDLTLNYNGRYAQGYVTVFDNDFRDFIALVDSGDEQDDTPIMNYLQRDARFRGVEFNLTLPLAQAGWGEVSVDVYGDRIRGEFDGGDNVPRLPPFRIGSRLNVKAGDFAAYAGVLHAADQDRSGPFEDDTEGYNRVDAGVSYTLKTFGDTSTLLFLRGTNLTNQTIRNSASVLRAVAPESGRSVQGGVRFTF